jgi:hypothetical protein
VRSRGGSPTSASDPYWAGMLGRPPTEGMWGIGTLPCAQLGPHLELDCAFPGISSPGGVVGGTT